MIWILPLWRILLGLVVDRLQLRAEHSRLETLRKLRIP